MELSQIPLFSLLTNRMTYLSARQGVLSQNVANANTPNYVARDLKAPDFGQMIANENRNMSASLTTTNVRHLAIRPTGQPFDEEDADGEGGSPAANVSIEAEMIKLSDTQVQYQTATNLYQKAVGMFRTALGGRSN